MRSAPPRAAASRRFQTLYADFEQTFPAQGRNPATEAKRVSVLCPQFQNIPSTAAAFQPHRKRRICLESTPGLSTVESRRPKTRLRDGEKTRDDPVSKIKLDQHSFNAQKKQQSRISRALFRSPSPLFAYRSNGRARCPSPRQKYASASQTSRQTRKSAREAAEHCSASCSTQNEQVARLNQHVEWRSPFHAMTGAL